MTRDSVTVPRFGDTVICCLMGIVVVLGYSVLIRGEVSKDCMLILFAIDGVIMTDSVVGIVDLTIAEVEGFEIIVKMVAFGSIKSEVGSSVSI